MADLEAVHSTDLPVQVSDPDLPVKAPRPGVTDPTPGKDEEDQAVMGLVDHLSELRHRMVVCILAVAIGSVVGFLLAPKAIEILKAPIAGPLRFTELGGAFFIQIKIAIILGAAFAMPVLLFELWGFISPGLTREERRVARPWVPLAMVFFGVGLVVAYFVLPYTASFLLGFAIPGVLDPLITAEAYFGFITTLFLASGVVMEFPIVLMLLAKAGIVDSKRLSQNRRYVLLGVVVFAVFITPGGDPVSPTMLGGVMFVLYEITIWLVRWSGR